MRAGATSLSRAFFEGSRRRDGATGARPLPKPQLAPARNQVPSTRAKRELHAVECGAFLTRSVDEITAAAMRGNLRLRGESRVARPATRLSLYGGDKHEK